MKEVDFLYMFNRPHENSVKLQNTQINFTNSEIYIGLVEHAMILGTASENK